MRRRRRRRRMRRNKNQHRSLLGCLLGVVLEASWGVWGDSWVPRGSSGGLLGVSWEPIGGEAQRNAKKHIFDFTVVAHAVSLCASLPPFSRQLSWASFLDGLVGIREASRIRFTVLNKRANTESTHSAARASPRPHVQATLKRTFLWGPPGPSWGQLEKS